MKTNTFYMTFIVLLSFHCTMLGQNYSIHWRAKRIGVAFSDSTLNATTKNAIVSDLQHCFNGWGGRAEIMTRVQGASMGYLDYGWDNPYYHKGVDFPTNVVADYATSGLALQVSKTLSDAYTNAFAFVAANASIVTAAYEFVSFVSSSNFVSISSNAVPNFVLFKNEDATSNAIVSEASQIIADVSLQSYYRPSVLGFYYSDKGPAATNLWMRVPCTSIASYSTSPIWSGFPAIWHDGKWKFCIWEDWVP